ncbi:hypothetical protein [Limosilactobacillus ingluviei]|uniref:hypothetical protein n=1 Tax=Limosilactobacillus ingluviei TaxID=148604 RepID=UPI0012E7CF35|nr:hypothetical protein [Limosilactobacillus ingluviei]
MNGLSRADSLMDQLLLRSSDSYRQLATFPTYVIFFCQFDSAAAGRATVLKTGKLPIP